MAEETKTQDLQEEEQKDKIELFHLLPGKPSYGSEYYFQHYLGSTTNISEQPIYFIEYPYHFRHNPIYSFELAFNYYIVNVLYKNNLKPSYFNGDIENWIDRTLRDGILNQLITNIKNIALEKYIKELKIQKNKSNKVKLIKHERVIRNSIDLAVAWLEDLNIKTHYYLYQSPKLDIFLENHLPERDGHDKQIYRTRLCICKYCCNEFIEVEDLKRLVPVDQLHTYDKTNTKLQVNRNKDIFQIKGCRSKYKNVFRNPLSEDISIAKEKLKILYVSLFNNDNLENYINNFNASLVNKADSRFFKSAKNVLDEYLKTIEIYKEISYVNQSFFLDVKNIISKIADKFSNKISDCTTLFSNNVVDIYLDEERHKLLQVPVPDRYEEIINKNTRIEEFKGGGSQGLVNVLAVEKELPRLTSFEICDLIELTRKNEQCSWYNS